MTDRVYPFNKPPGIQKPPGYNQNAASKAQIYRPAMPSYRPRPQRKRNHCCIFCIWFFIILLSLILLVGIAGFILYIMYRPQEPSFSVRTLQIPRLTVTTKAGGTHLNSEVIVEVEARNPNKKLSFSYEQSKVSVSSDDVNLGQGSFPPFFHGRKNTTVLKYDIKVQDTPIDEADGKSLRLKYAKKKLALDVELDTHVSVKVGKWKSSKIKIIVACSGVPASSSKAKATDTQCKIKLFKWFSFKIFK
eukprot:Gb_41030 [translate_table: standard]